MTAQRVNITRARLIAGALTLVGLAVTVIVVRTMYLNATDHPLGEFHPMEFDAAVWRENEPEYSWESIRLRMVDDLLASDILIGLTHDEIVALLGSAPATEYFNDWDLVYYLGAERSYLFAIDSEWLLLRLDDSGRVSEAVTATD